MPSLRELLSERACRGLARHGWLLDCEVGLPDFEERMQWILIQVTLQYLLLRQFRILGWVTDAMLPGAGNGYSDGNISLVRLIRIGVENEFFTARESRWLFHLNSRANEAKHRFSSL